MAYLRQIAKPKCDCGKPATVEVFGAMNCAYGPKCSACGHRLVADLNREERRDRPTASDRPRPQEPT